MADRKKALDGRLSKKFDGILPAAGSAAVKQLKSQLVAVQKRRRAAADGRNWTNKRLGGCCYLSSRVCGARVDPSSIFTRRTTRCLRAFHSWMLYHCTVERSRR